MIATSLVHTLMVRLGMVASMLHWLKDPNGTDQRTARGNKSVKVKPDRTAILHLAHQATQSLIHTLRA